MYGAAFARYLTSNRRASDQAPGEPEASLARTRHHILVAGSVLAVNCDGPTDRLRTSGAEKLCESSISIVYPAVAFTSDQSNAIDWPVEKRASRAGLTRDGAGSGPEGAGATMSVEETAAAANTAEIVADVDAVTTLVVNGNVAVVDPASTVTLAGTLATPALVVERATTAPPDGAALESATVPWTLAPPVAVDGFKVTR